MKTLKQVVDDLIASKPEGGFIYLEDLGDLCPDNSRAECLQALRENPRGIIVSGRRASKTKFVWGHSC
jgi:hypothetical protein